MHTSLDDARWCWGTHLTVYKCVATTVNVEGMDLKTKKNKKRERKRERERERWV